MPSQTCLFVCLVKLDEKLVLFCNDVSTFGNNLLRLILTLKINLKLANGRVSLCLTQVCIYTARHTAVLNWRINELIHLLPLSCIVPS